jgi:hypothetical protein
VIERWYERIYAIGGKYRGEVFEFYCRDSGLLELDSWTGSISRPVKERIKVERIKVSGKG